MDKIASDELGESDDVMHGVGEHRVITVRKLEICLLH